MATIVVTMKIMPDSPDADLAKIEQSAKEKIAKFCGEVAKSEHVPIAFGLIAINLYFVMDEKKGSTESLENEISLIDEVQSVEVTDVRRAIG
jgi:translation elongation factor aEF-1 beta